MAAWAKKSEEGLPVEVFPLGAVEVKGMCGGRV